MAVRTGAFAALVALHELYGMARALRPLVLAGYVGALATLLGAQLGGTEWMIGGFMLTLVLAFLLYGIAETRQTATVTMSTTILGTAWIALGLGFLLLLRDFPEYGRIAVFAVLIAVFADDTAAYLVGRLVGRHKLAPSLSPGKTWEGFVAGTIAAVAASFFTLYDDRHEFLAIWQALALGLAIALAGAAGDLFESALKRDLQVKDSGRLLGGHGGMLDRIDALLFAVGRRLLRGHRAGVGHTVPVKRVALLGATGSIGRQAIEVVERNPELELCALSSGSADLAALAAEHAVSHTQVGGDLTRAARVLGAGRRPECGRRLRRGRRNAVGARARGSRSRSRTRRASSPPARWRSRRRSGEEACCCRSTPSTRRSSSASKAASRSSVDSLVLTASGGPFRGRTRADLADVGVEDALAHPTWSMGPKITVDSATLANKGLELIEAHFLFGVPYERIEVVVHPSSIVHSLVRFRDGAALAHLGYPDMTVPISFALTYPERAATDVPALDLAAG